MHELSKLNKYLSQFISEERNSLFHQVLANRTRYLTVVLENIYQSQNTSAVLRTSDCFGIQDVHIIENNHPYNINPDVALGSHKWLNLVKYNAQKNNTLAVINKLKQNGYRIVATPPHTNDVNIENFDLEKGKAAFFFGTELTGLTQTMLEHADEFVKIPMYGFTESFNISVSVAITLHQLIHNLRNSNINWKLSEDEKEQILFQWLKSSIKKVDLILDDYSAKTGSDISKII